jgi:hypothetical protein
MAIRFMALWPYGHIALWPYGLLARGGKKGSRVAGTTFGKKAKTKGRWATDLKEALHSSHFSCFGEKPEKASKEPFKASKGL